MLKSDPQWRKDLLKIMDICRLLVGLGEAELPLAEVVESRVQLSSEGPSSGVKVKCLQESTRT